MVPLGPIIDFRPFPNRSTCSVQYFNITYFCGEQDTLKSLSRSNTTSILQLSNSKDKHYQAVRGHATSLVLQAIQRQQTTEEVGGQEAVGDVCSRRSPRQGRNVSSAVDTQKHDTSDEEILAVSREAEEQCHLERASKCG